MLIRRLNSDDAEVYVHFRRAALRESPFSFGSSPEDDRARSVSWVREAVTSTDNAIFGAFDAAALIGIVGVNRDRGVKTSHKVDMWGLYVDPSVRRKGAARMLMTEALRHARSLAGVTHVYLSVSDSAQAAMALYRSLGFQTWGVEPAALRIGNVDETEHHMFMAIDR